MHFAVTLKVLSCSQYLGEYHSAPSNNLQDFSEIKRISIGFFWDFSRKRKISVKM